MSRNRRVLDHPELASNMALVQTRRESTCSFWQRAAARGTTPR